MVLVGDARGKVAILVDDMADTCGTIVQVLQICLGSLVLPSFPMTLHTPTALLSRLIGFV